ncbi:MAG: alpha/beta fold hydrolase [Gemmatimonadaceae bacterium]
MTAGPPHETGFLDRVVKDDGIQSRYQLYVPANFDRSADWPVILSLHGAGERGNDGLLQTAIGLGNAIRRHRELIPAVVVFPQVPADGLWLGQSERIALHALHAAVAECGGDPDRIYVVGLSMGGYGAWEMASAQPERFAAIVSVCGGVTPPATGATMLQPPQVAENAPDPFAAVAARVAPIPAWLFHGADDTIVPPMQSRTLVAALRIAGGDPRYTEYPDVGHNSWDRAFAEPELWTWLLAQKRPLASH